MKRPEWVKNLISKGLSKEEVIEELKKGNEEEGIKPVTGKSESETNSFAKLVYNKIVNPKKTVEQPKEVE